MNETEQDFTLDKVFTDDGDKAIIKKLDSRFSVEAASKHLLMIMDRMSLRMRTFLRLNILHK